MSSLGNDTTGMMASASANVYDLLARLWITEIDASVWNHLNQPDVASAWLEVGGWLPEFGGDQDDVIQQVNQLELEYCSCFLGPKGHLPPYQSVVASSRFGSDRIDSVKQYVEIIGDLEGLFRDQQMKDHAGVQLHLMSRIYQEIADCLETAGENSLGARLTSLDSLRFQFAQDHLAWLTDYCDVALRRFGGQQSGFYVGLFRVTRQVVRTELGQTD